MEKKKDNKTIREWRKRKYFLRTLVILIQDWQGGEGWGFIMIPVGFEPRTSRYSRSPRYQLNSVPSVPLSQAGFFFGVKWDGINPIYMRNVCRPSHTCKQCKLDLLSCGPLHNLRTWRIEEQGTV